MASISALTAIEEYPVCGPAVTSRSAMSMLRDIGLALAVGVSVATLMALVGIVIQRWLSGE